MIEITPDRLCYDSTRAILYEPRRVYVVDEVASSRAKGNGLLKHFVPLKAIDVELVLEAERPIEEPLEEPLEEPVEEPG